ncbi:MAG: agmatine deiminase family protein [Bacteroides sp.]|nr:agmatine deiminase family protein [Bacteroides sp.]
MSNSTRFPAEWESAKAILVALPHAGTDWHYILPEAIDQFHRLIKAMVDAGEFVVGLATDMDAAKSNFSDINPGSFKIIEMPLNDTWTRDYGPISVERNGRMRALDFGFNGWGLKFAADNDNLVNVNLARKALIPSDVYRNRRGFILEGGSLETDGAGLMLTTSECLLSPNRNGGMDKKEIAETLSNDLGVDHILWLDYGALEGDDTDSHIDTLCRIAPGNSILFTGCRNVDDSHFESLLKMRAQLEMFRNAEGEPFNLIELPLPDPIYDENGDRLPATYANYLVTPRNLFMPTYNQPINDRLACQMVRVAFPTHNIVPVDCTTLIRQHGSLHCSTMQIPDGIFDNVVFENLECQ